MLEQLGTGKHLRRNTAITRLKNQGQDAPPVKFMDTHQFPTEPPVPGVIFCVVLGEVVTGVFTK